MKTKLERSIDARHEGFNAVDAFNEQAFEPKKSIVKKTKKMEGLKEYTDKEIEKLSGPVKSTNIYGPCSWEEFKKMDKALQIKYIEGIKRFYKDVTFVDLALMFGKNSLTVTTYLNKLGIRSNGTRKMTKSRIDFRTNFIKKSEEPRFDVKPVKEKEFITSITLVCDVEDLIEVAKKYGFENRVKITISR